MHAGYFLTQSGEWTPVGHTTAWVANSLYAAVADSISLYTDRGRSVIDRSGIVRSDMAHAVLTDSHRMEVLISLDTACGLQMMAMKEKRV
jgi:hypothetical protein